MRDTDPNFLACEDERFPEGLIGETPRVEDWLVEGVGEGQRIVDRLVLRLEQHLQVEVLVQSPYNIINGLGELRKHHH